MIAAVLAGGLGTRLASVLTDRPKVLAPINGRAFLDILLERLAAGGVTGVVMCLGFRADAVLEHLAANPPPVPVRCSVEPEPLGTAGALALARPLLTGDPVMVVNGDTWIDFDLQAFRRAHKAPGATVLAVEVDDVSRYGGLDIDPSGSILAFREKSAGGGPGWINAGFSLLSGDVLDDIAAIGAGSLERDVFARMTPERLRVHRVRAGFIDIGTPESFAEAPTIIS